MRGPSFPCLVGIYFRHGVIDSLLDYGASYLVMTTKSFFYIVGTVNGG